MNFGSLWFQRLCRHSNPSAPCLFIVAKRPSRSVIFLSIKCQNFMNSSALALEDCNGIASGVEVGGTAPSDFFGIDRTVATSNFALSESSTMFVHPMIVTGAMPNSRCFKVAAMTKCPSGACVSSSRRAGALSGSKCPSLSGTNVDTAESIPGLKVLTYDQQSPRDATRMECSICLRQPAPAADMNAENSATSTYTPS